MRDFKAGFAQRVTRRVGFHRGEGEGGLPLRSLQGCGKGEMIWRNWQFLPSSSPPLNKYTLKVPYYVKLTLPIGFADSNVSLPGHQTTLEK